MKKFYFPNDCWRGLIMSLIIKESVLTVHSYPKIKLKLYPHQCVMLEKWDDLKTVLLITKTGSGKTAAAVLPLLLNQENALLVYPTNALMADQVGSIQGLVRELDMSSHILMPENAREKDPHADVTIVRIDAYQLELFCKEFNIKDKTYALLRLLDVPRKDSGRCKLVLINPDILYLIYRMNYGRNSHEVIAKLQAFKNIIFDEFHLYWGIELAHVLFLTYFARKLETFEKVVLLSATPDKSVLDLIKKVLGAPVIIDTNTRTNLAAVGKRVVNKQLILDIKLTVGDIVNEVIRCLNERREYIEKKANLNEDISYVPAVVVLNSVLNVIHLEDKLRKKGWNNVGVVRGLMAKGERQFKGKTIVLGTSAIEVGIDFKTDILLFEASDSASFMQRLGRAGRHQAGEVILFTDGRIKTIFESKGQEYTREEFEHMVQEHLSARDSFAWFVTTRYGLLTVMSLTESIKEKILTDKNLTEEKKENILGFLEKLLNDYAELLGCESHVKNLNSVFNVARKRGKKSTFKWLLDYVKNSSFRSNIPSLEVWDRSEKIRGRFPVYDVDVITILKKASSIEIDRKGKEKIRITGYGGNSELYFHQNLNGLEPGKIYSVSEVLEKYNKLTIIRNKGRSELSDYLTNPENIMVVVPRSFADSLDWRIPKIDCGIDGVNKAIFNNSALMVAELYKQSI